MHQYIVSIRSSPHVISIRRHALSENPHERTCCVSQFILILKQPHMVCCRLLKAASKISYRSEATKNRKKGRKITSQISPTGLHHFLPTVHQPTDRLSSPHGHKHPLADDTWARISAWSHSYPLTEDHSGTRRNLRELAPAADQPSAPPTRFDPADIWSHH
jgi:hypothetical protein